jgi:hypothetical protein
MKVQSAAIEGEMEPSDCIGRNRRGTASLEPFVVNFVIVQWRGKLAVSRNAKTWQSSGMRSGGAQRNLDQRCRGETNRRGGSAVWKSQQSLRAQMTAAAVPASIVRGWRHFFGQFG